MQFKLTKSSDVFGDETKTIELTTLEELMTLCKQSKTDRMSQGRIILFSPSKYQSDWTIEIYDDYRE